MKALRYIIFIVSVTSVLGCEQRESRTEVKSEQIEAGESFDTFFTKFNRDSIFQKTRVVFPFKLIQSDGESDTTIFIQRNGWQYVDFSFPDKKNVVTQERVNDNEIKVLLQVEDTGIHVQHLFQKKKGQWWFVYVKSSYD